MAGMGLTGCAMGSGVVPYGPGTWLVSDMRAPVLGGAAAAQDAAVAEGEAFCARQGGVFSPLSGGPGGYPYGHYGPTDFTAVFRCAAR